jgi:hypothetical protein
MQAAGLAALRRQELLVKVRYGLPRMHQWWYHMRVSECVGMWCLHEAWQSHFYPLPELWQVVLQLLWLHWPMRAVPPCYPLFWLRWRSIGYRWRGGGNVCYTRRDMQKLRDESVQSLRANSSIMGVMWWVHDLNQSDWNLETDKWFSAIRCLMLLLPSNWYHD